MLKINNGCWTNCEEDLPDDGVMVLVTDGKRVDVGYLCYDDGLWDTEFSFIDPDGIEAWMPFPVNPEELYLFNTETFRYLNDEKGVGQELLRDHESCSKPSAEWISVADKMPAANDNVLVCHISGVIEVGYAYNVCGDLHWLHVAQYGPVTHWMPLPEEPKDV